MNNQKNELSQPTDDLVTNAYDQIVFHLLEEQNLHGSKRFLFCGCEPGVGTTTVVTRLGSLLAGLGKRVLILEGDYRKPSSHKGYPGMCGYITDPDTALEECLFQSSTEGLWVLPSGEAADRHVRRILYSPRFQEAMEQLKERFDVILMDSGAVDTSNDVLPLAALSDGVVLICALKGSPKSKLSKAYRKLTENRCNLIGVIENMVDMREYRSYMEDYDYYTPSAAAKDSRE